MYPDQPRAFDLNKATDKLSNNIIALTNTVHDHSKLIIDNPIKFVTQHPDTLTIKNYFAKTTILDTAESYRLVELCLHPLIDVINQHQLDIQTNFLQQIYEQIDNTYKIPHETFPTHMMCHLRKSFSDSLDNLCNYLEDKYSHRSSTTERVTPSTNTQTMSDISTTETHNHTIKKMNQKSLMTLSNILQTDH